jgi:transglutaminase-like putative cysteine protease
MIGALRSWQLSARYVSGYLRSSAEYRGAEASHAWVAVFCPG